MDDFINGYNWVAEHLDSVALDDNGYMYSVKEVPEFVKRYIEIYNIREKRDKEERELRKKLGLAYEPYPVEKPEFQDLFEELLKILSD